MLTPHYYGRFHSHSQSVSLTTTKHNSVSVLRKTLQGFIDLQREQARNSTPRGRSGVVYACSLKVILEDRCETVVMSQRLSLSGIEFLSDRSLLGQKLRLYIPRNESTFATMILSMRVLWSQAVADGIFKNGGNFLNVQFDHN